MREAARLDPKADAEALAGKVAAARGLFADFAPLGEQGPLTPLMETIARLLEGDRSGAVNEATRLVAAVPEPEREEAASAAVAAISATLTNPPHPVDEILRATFFEAMMDPTTALVEPRSVFSKLRKLFAGFALAAAITAALPAIAYADEPSAPTGLEDQDLAAEVVDIDDEDDGAGGGGGDGGGSDIQGDEGDDDEGDESPGGEGDDDGASGHAADGGDLDEGHGGAPDDTSGHAADGDPVDGNPYDGGPDGGGHGGHGEDDLDDGKGGINW
jgi:hypothetical protein